jgi:hypothetical protein
MDLSNLHKLINNARGTSYLLHRSSALDNVIQKHCQWMREHNKLTHNGFVKRLKESGLSYTLSGEVVASGQDSPESVLRAWLRSLGHRRILLNLKFNTIGLGYYQGYWGGILVRSLSKPESIPSDLADIVKTTDISALVSGEWEQEAESTIQ